MKICFVTSECVPYVKTGGLADVSGSLPVALSKLNVEVKIFLPLYELIDRKKYNLALEKELSGVKVNIGGIDYEYNVYSCIHLHSNVKVYFIECNELYSGDSVYTTGETESTRFILFQNAVLMTLQRLQWSPDIFHCNDWQSALIPSMLKITFKWDRLFENSRSLISIHNIGYQGVFPKDTIKKTSFPESMLVLGGPFEFNGYFSFLKAGIVYADIITTVSKTYAREIQTPEFGSGLDGVIKSRSDNVIGILNGIDYDVWHPSVDNYISSKYSSVNLEDKKKNKINLLEKCNLLGRDDYPLFTIISRLAWQKGFELLFPFLDEFLEKEISLVVLGTGEKQYEDFFIDLQKKHKEKVFCYIGYNNELSHQITAGGDFFIMPSRYEPCGLNQMYSLLYGNIPIVRKTGGLADTVIDISNENGNGFVFNEFEPESLLEKMNSALELYSDKEKLNEIRKRGMNLDFSWNKSAKEYLEVYNKLKSL